MKSITRKTLLYRSGVEYADFCINHVEGCAHGCKFPCYAMMMKKRCGTIKNYQDWIKPKLVSNALDILDKEIPKYKKQIRFVHLCFATDPFMYKYPEVSDLTLKIIARLHRDGIRSTVLTKGLYPKDLKNQIDYGANNEYGITLISMNEKFRRDYEPYTAPYKERVKSLKYLHDKGLKTWVSIEPYPTQNIVEQNFANMLQEIGFVDKIIFGKWNYNVKISAYDDSKNFYEQRAQEVIGFCKKRGIEYHIKFGTSQANNNKSAKLFKVKPVQTVTQETLELVPM